MKQLKSIDERILHLKKIKETAEVRLARTLFKKVYPIMADDFDVNLIATVLRYTWHNASCEQKGQWRTEASFCSKADHIKSHQQQHADRQHHVQQNDLTSSKAV